AVASEIADDVIVMYAGRIVEQGPIRTILRDPRHPYTRALLASVLTPEPGLGIPDTGLGLAFPDPLNPPPGCPFHPRCPDAIGICRVQMPPLAPTLAGVAACHVHAPAQGALAA
ncbi:MAG TPA: oligopeptide/dipeptide ABC transporter ATP-binding protein, partial [Beijerinckiaceae bacterium]|nr:oligopeptide/dipeptide ABC transporter ATP-binding protein [Beijerinckiaceae bacterium]